MSQEVPKTYANGFCEQCKLPFEEHRGLDHDPHKTFDIAGGDQYEIMGQKVTGVNKIIEHRIIV